MTPRSHVRRARARARAPRRDATPPQIRLRGFSRALRVAHHVRRQAPFRRYVLDFVSYRYRLVIEVDGDQHRLPERAARDAPRDWVL
jgi:very-short-patch-repair endonuclease